MVEHAHREHGVEGLQRRQLLDAQRQQMRPLVVTEQLTHRFKLAQEQLVGSIPTARCAPAPIIRHM